MKGISEEDDDEKLPSESSSDSLAYELYREIGGDAILTRLRVGDSVSIIFAAAISDITMIALDPILSNRINYFSMSADKLALFQSTLKRRYVERVIEEVGESFRSRIKRIFEYVHPTHTWIFIEVPVDRFGSTFRFDAIIPNDLCRWMDRNSAEFVEIREECDIGDAILVRWREFSKVNLYHEVEAANSIDIGGCDEANFMLIERSKLPDCMKKFHDLMEIEKRAV